MADSISMLRDALRNNEAGKDMSREAGSGIWAEYVRSTMSMAGQPVIRSVEEFEAATNNVVAELEAIAPLTKHEKNSLRSAKCVVKKVVEAGKPLSVWKFDGSGSAERDEYGRLVPVGKSELQDAKTDIQRMLGYVAAIQKKLDSESIEMDVAEYVELAKALQTVTASVWQAGANAAGEYDAGTFIRDNS
jgi:hypothetical protein